MNRSSDLVQSRQISTCRESDADKQSVWALDQQMRAPPKVPLEIIAKITEVPCATDTVCASMISLCMELHTSCTTMQGELCQAQQQLMTIKPASKNQRKAIHSDSINYAENGNVGLDIVQ